MRHRKRRVFGDGLFEQRDRTIGFALVVDAERPGVGAQRIGRTRRHLVEGRVCADAPERLTDLLTE